MSAGTLCFSFVLFGAMITIRLSGVVKPHAPNEADELWRDSTYLAGAAQLEEGGSCPVRSEDLSHR